MKYGEMIERTYCNWFNKGEKWTTHEPYKRAEWHEYHTDNFGDGLWIGTQQILGTCQFTVRGCRTEKAAIAKVRRYAKNHYEKENLK